MLSIDTKPTVKWFCASANTTTCDICAHEKKVASAQLNSVFVITPLYRNFFSSFFLTYKTALKSFRHGQSSSTLTPEMSAKIKTRVNDIIANNKVVVFSKTYCPYCTKAKNALAKHYAGAHIVELDSEEDGAAIQAYLLELTGQRTVPNIFIDHKHIGGCDDLLALDKNGQLKTLLAKI
ncbi:unnamed protein product [Mortierella alpina]